jgi:potassium-transporting ATPase KdpC subunit
MRRQLLPALLMMVVFTGLLGLAYPLVVTGIAQGVFGDKADGSLVEVDGEAVGSSLVGQAFVDEDGEPMPEYFQSRPSAATGAAGETTAGYDPTLSLGSNLGPSNPELSDAVRERVRAYQDLNGLDDGTPVPVDAVTASGSGLDPHISVANARLQAPRVAGERGLDVDDVFDLIDENTDRRQLGFLGEDGVNVLELNLALDRATGS